MERKKILWIVIALGGTLSILLLLGYVFISGNKSRGAYDPATLNLRASPRISNPEDLVRPGASLSPISSPKPGSDGDLLVVFGQNPEFASPQPLGSAMPSGQVAMNPDTAQPTPGWASAKPSLKPASTPSPRVSTAVAKAPAQKAPAKTSAKASKTVTLTEHWIQTGAFTSKGKAEEFKESLTASGLSPIIKTAEVDGLTWYQVRVGPYSSKAEAEGWLTRIRKLDGCSKSYRTEQRVKRII